MNKLYNSIDPVVIDDELMRQALDEGREPKDAKELHLALSKLTTLQLPFKSEFFVFLICHLNSSFLESFILKDELIIEGIRRIDNLNGLNKLTKLQLDNNDIEVIENLDHLVHLTWLGERCDFWPLF